MQIAMISYWSCPLTRLGVAMAGGMNVYVLNLANALGALGHTVDIYTQAHGDGDDLDDALNPHVSVVHLPRQMEDPFEDVEQFAQQVAVEARKRQRRYDVLHAHYYFSALAGLRLREQLKLRLFVTFHTLGIMKEQYAGIVDQQRIAAETAIIAGVDAIVASTELEKADLIEWHDVPPDKVHIVHPGVDHHLFRPYDQHAARKALGLDQAAHLILFVGRIDPIKGIHTLIDAFDRLLTEDAGALRPSRLLLIGGDPEDERFWRTGEGRALRQEIDERQLEEQVVLLGSRPHEELARYYAAADLVVVPSAYETFGFVALEAMACGSPVIASNVGGLHYLVQDRVNGRLFDPGDSDELCAIMRELLGDRAQRELLGKQAAASSHRYCWDKQAEKLLALYAD